MVTWTTSRNNHINEPNDEDRVKQIFALIKDRLLNASTPWTMLGYGDGNSNTSMSASGVTDPFPSFPNITGGTVDINDNSWMCLQNDDGVEIVVQIDDDDISFWWSVNGGYATAGDESASLRPGNSSPPSDEVGHGDYGIDAGCSSEYYCSIAVSGDGNSFILFANVSDVIGMALVKCEDTKTGDTHPYWSLEDDTYSFSDSTLSPNSNTDFIKGYHPSGGALCYKLSNIDFYGNIMDDIVPDPYTGNHQLLEPLAGCMDSPYYHIRGKVPGFLRNPDARSIGDLFNSGEYVCMGQWSVPWGSTDSLL